ncbi:leucyl aminopeptidase [Planktotalea arctica]|uniref:leucyl aminopeptidase n=1 Tax=Planktotalea arctica TaxID=1481893 RepID=UPI000A16D88B|nr:leucyl aminopeptidase [Planktotalea arctica]
MPNLIAPTFAAVDLDAIAAFEGRVALLIGADGKLDAGARRVNRLTKGAIARVVEAGKLEDAKAGKIITLNYPAGMAATALDIICLERRPDALDARKAGAALGKALDKGAALLLAGSNAKPAQIVLGAAMRAYEFTPHKSDAEVKARSLTVMCAKPEEAEPEARAFLAVAEGAHMTRDLTNEPANVLTTTEFAIRLKEMESLGLVVEVLEEAELERLGMRTLLSVGQGSDSPSKVVVMHWNGGEKGVKPLALIGKGVVFDTGGISLKPAAGMEDMTMDMGGAGVVSGVMRTLALRGAKANVVGLVGLVENMPSSNATRPGDVIKSMKGDTVEVINTDAEGRLVLCDVMWYAQERFAPVGMIDLATLTGAIVVGLGHENAGVFSNDDALCSAFLNAAKAEGEGAWRMPLGQAYDDLLKSRIADMKNIGGRAAGSVTAAQFLQRFVKDGTPWIHLDIAGVASVKSETTLAPVGATGWGVMSLSRLVQDLYEH